jgi:hypothetical protein
MLLTAGLFRCDVARTIIRNDGRREQMLDISPTSARIERIEYPDGRVWTAPRWRLWTWQVRRWWHQR